MGVTIQELVDRSRERMRKNFEIGEAESFLKTVCAPEDKLDDCSSATEDIVDACKTNATEAVCKRATRAIIHLYCLKKEDSKACSYQPFIFDLWNSLIGAGGGSLIMALLLILIFFFIYRRKMKKIRKVSGATNGTVSQDGTSGGTGTTGTGSTRNGTTGTTQNANNQMTMNRY